MSSKRPVKAEKPTLLGARVYKEHRRMLRVIGRKRQIKGSAQVMRTAIEEMYARTTA